MIDKDPEQFRWFAKEVQPHEAALRGFLCNHFPSLHDIDDVVQESYIRLLRAQASGPIASPRGLLFSVARNLAVDALRHRQVITFEQIPENTESFVYKDSTNVAETASRTQELALLREAIQSLPDRCRQVITLRAVYGLSQREIAEQLRISESAVEKQLHKGLRSCGIFFAQHGLPIAN